MDAFVSVANAWSFMIFESGWQNDVAEIIIDDHYVVVTLTGGGNEPTCLVRIDLASGFKDGGKTVVSAFHVSWAGRKDVICHFQKFRQCDGGDGSGFS